MPELISMSNKIITVDVREDIRNGREPFQKIMFAVAQLGPDEQLLLLAPFEPVPLFHVLAKQGFQHRAQPTQTGDWEVLFSREALSNKTMEFSSPMSFVGKQSPEQITKVEPAISDESNTAVSNQRRAGDCAPYPTGIDSSVTELDARGLEPPQPMVKILETLAGLPEAVTLHARTDRRPMHLYAQLEARGFTGTTEEQNDGSFITHICRR